MINFGKLQVRTNEKYSFVGIENKNSQLIFHVPKGFSQDDPSIDTFNFKRDLFFKLYRVLDIFKQTLLEKGHSFQEIKASDRDGIIQEEEGAEIDGENKQEINFSKLDALEKILDAYDELKILALVSRLGKTEKLDYSKLHHFLHKGIFLENGAVYVDSMVLPRKEVRFEVTDIINMYCYILVEIKHQLEQEVSSEVRALAEQFRQKYIGSESTLFNELTYEQVMNDLKDALEVIDNYTPIKEPDYWYFYDAIEAFLFGDLNYSKKGLIWGISNFHSVWESMCLNYLCNTHISNLILYVDNKFIKYKNYFKKEDNILNLENVFLMQVKQENRRLYPDAVIISLNYSNFNLQLIEKDLKSHIITKDDSWNDDYAYYTKFSCQKLKNNWLKIAYENQPKDRHTFDVFPKRLKTSENSISIAITRLPEKFSSYWPLNYPLLIEEIQMMRSFNHIFWVALAKGVTSENDFKKFIEQLENSSKDVDVGRKFSKLSNVFKSSLLSESREEEFRQFVENSCFHIIDIKYDNFAYYKDSENLEKIKVKNVRKQFVYEYLLQNHLDSSNSLVKKCSIKSEFWLPTYSPNSPALTEGPEYLDGYIKLRGVNIMAVIDSYLNTEVNKV
ncbi:hypothetical protein [Floridanema evergladense]|uniref:DUF2357 domain-containing protein n=1 Tax=Floridaenema evergladense BLCC-F167 TaxID=3153639 RepID=A0ABV4WEH0_9CYAN